MPEFLTYKGRPLVRHGNIIYYGNMTEKYVIRLEILSSTKVAGADVSDKVNVKLLLTENAETGKAEKETEKDGLYNALDIGCIWLDRALKKD